MKILVLSISTGSGQIRSANAIKDYMENNIENCTVDVVDILKYISPVIDTLISGGHFRTIRNIPVLYAKSQEISEEDENLLSVTKMLNDMLSLQIANLIDESMANLIAATHPFHMEILSGLKNKGIIDVPVIALIPDYGRVSNSWINDFASAYVIPHEDLVSELIKGGIPNQKVFTHGIPVNTTSFHYPNRKSLLENLGLQDKPTILLMGNTIGALSIKTALKSLILPPLDFQIIIFTGHNTRLKKQINEIIGNNNKAIAISMDPDMLSDFMSVSDLLITKPIGIIISEALTKQLPISILSPMVGQEAEITDYLVRKGAVIKFDEDGSLKDRITCFLNDSKRIDEMKSCQKKLAKPNGVADISNLIMTLVKDNSHSIKISPANY